MENSNEGIKLLTIIGTAVMMLFIFAIVLFIIIYQRRISLKQAEIVALELENQKELMSAVIVSKEQEQRRIAEELHDDVGSILTAIKFSIPQLVKEEETKVLLINNISEAIQKVRRISNELLPSVLDELGLTTAIEALIKTLSNQNIRFNFTVDINSEKNSKNIDKNVELAFYRILQELINNIIKYANANQVFILLKIENDNLILSIQDDGLGFVPLDHIEKSIPSLGLKNIESRIQQINGFIHYEKTNPGTKVTLAWTKEK
jgi:signal transduction histidine kinase